MYNKSKIKEIFYSGSYGVNYDEQLIVNIVFLLQEGVLSVTQKTIAKKSDYTKYIDKINSGEISKFDIEGCSIGHLALKLVAQKFLNEQGYERVIFEQEYDGYRPDVITPDHKIIVECGNTNPDKIFNYFKNKKLEGVIIIPYPDDETDQLNAYNFKPTEDLAEFLLFLEKEKMKNAKNHCQ